ncbi:RagB/SusD family nutrient uptake outer membrane protein [Dysgonomonas sp. GY75]|uniref:RagB/SusD family nutrient uptake outer membrane protein n=1 Tax=Dysgonomonas sp. GY75 TaxID=2780419 RepID=UPI001883B788|nr:RagB/SusD family nutrient uptake outer membrane protein [Dysgonomonas sp. GY75]MBF0649876.1 RagB/SusD family nutrient uptake outer membrane protein [Dysgonomonas sp. GY75]
MKSNILIISILIACCNMFSSCLGDLDTQPLDKNQLVAKDVYETAAGYKGVIAKCYASLIQTGQKGGDGGDGDVGGIDEGYSGYTRALFYLQTTVSDEIILHAGSSQGSRDLLYVNWNPSTSIIKYPYYRLYMTINYCNEFIRECTEDKLKERGVYDELKDEYRYYVAEARFIRAYCYSMICDLYGSGPFIEETMVVGSLPHQKTRTEIYDYAVSELETVLPLLKTSKTNQYGRIDQVAAWFLLARIYLNSEVYVGKKEYEKAYKYAKMVIDSKAYPLAPDYRHIFLADNNTCSEIIWHLVQDADYAQSSAGTNFYVKALMNGNINSYLKTGVGTRGWGNARVTTQLVNLFESGDQTFDVNDIWGNNKKDKRAQFFSVGHTKETWVDGKDFQGTFTNGYACIKWRNVKADGSELAEGGTVYSSIDYPMFRTADAYLMAAEAILRGGGGSKSEALDYVNEIRDRAYMSGSYGNDASGRITEAELNLDFILDERGRELYTELIRRTDLIRFNKFTKNHNWDWKGSDGKAGNYVGKDVDNKYKLFPIPQEEFTVNPYLTQNPDYK